MSTMAERTRRMLLRHVVARTITCPRTGEVLDMDTCVVLNDNDGDPAVVLSQKGWSEVPEATRESLAARGYRVDESSVR